jgi:hypothetical protein
MRTGVSGPVVIYGNDNPQQVSDTEAGPNFDYQSNALFDSRYASQATAAGEGAQGGVLGSHNPVQIESLSAFPVANNTTAITTSQTPAAGAFFALNTAVAAGVAPNMPLIPQGNPIIPGSSNLVNVMALDFGFAIGTTTTAAATAQVVTITGPTATLPAGYTASAVYGTRFFYPGQRILIAGAGNAAGTAPLSTVVTATDRYAAPGFALAAAGTITIANPALFAAAGLSIGTADQEYGVAVKPVVKAGAGRIYDPAQMLSRVVTVTSGSTTASGTVIVRGYDIYEQPMSQLITIPTTASTNTGTKAFAYISSVQVSAGGVTTGGVSIGTGGLFGLPMRTDLVEYQLGYFGGVAIAIASYVMADQTTPATNTVGGSGDVRGTVAVTANGTTRLTVLQTAPIIQAKVTNNIDYRGLFGVTNA